MASTFLERFSSGRSNKLTSRASRRAKATRSIGFQRMQPCNTTAQLIDAHGTNPLKQISNGKDYASKETTEKITKGDKPPEVFHTDRATEKLGLNNTNVTVEQPLKTLPRDVLAARSTGIKKPGPKPKSTVTTTKVPLKLPHEHEKPKTKEADIPISALTINPAKVIPKPASSNKSHFEHPLSLSFKDASKTYTDNLKEVVPSLLTSGYALLKGQLAAASSNSANQLDDLNARHDALFCPIGSVELEIHLNKGKPDEKVRYVTLATRMQEFTALFEKSAEKLNGLHEKWLALREEIRALKVVEEDGTEAPHGTYVSQLHDLTLKYQTKEEEASREFERKLAEIMDRAVQAEKMFDERRRQSNKQLLLLIQQEEETEI